MVGGRWLVGGLFLEFVWVQIWAFYGRFWNLYGSKYGRFGVVCSMGRICGFSIFIPNMGYFWNLWGPNMGHFGRFWDNSI